MSANNNSCVPQVRLGEHSIMLPGDIEAPVERALVLRYGEELQSDIVLAPHHGSTSSSSYAFIKRLQPTFVVFSAGYRNSFGHPAESIVSYADYEFHHQYILPHSSPCMQKRWELRPGKNR